MKIQFLSALTVSGVLALAGCDSSVPSGGTGTVPVDRRPADPTPSRTEVNARDGDVDVEVGKRGDRPAVDVDVKPGGDVNVDVDRDNIRDRIEERREERRIP